MHTYVLFKNFLLYEEKKDQTANLSVADKKVANGIRKVIYTNGDNLTSTNIEHNDDDAPQLNNLGIVIDNVTAKWTNAQTENSLENISLTVTPGRLVGVIGPVGAGKVYKIILYYFNGWKP